VAIECPKCRFDNPDDTAYCGKCATPLSPQEEISISQTKTLETPVETITRGTTFAGRYEIIEELGKGGMGKVYRAVDKKLKEEVALKLIKPEIASDKKTLERFQNELKLARKIRHSNVGGMYELLEDKGTHFISMEYIHGQDLKGLIRQTGKLAISTAISITKQACDGLAEAHKLGIIHRDLKPSNIMIDKEGDARIMDFGIARSIKGKGITGAGVMIGTPEYMSPEQAEVKEVDQRSDIYSLGVILYEMVTGRVPFEGETPLSIAMKHKSEMPKDPREINAQIPDDLSKVILRCMEKDKEKRCQSTGEMRSELENIEKGLPTTDRVIPKRKTTTSKEITVTFKKRWMLIVSPFIILLVAALVYFFSRIGKEALPSENKKIVVLPFKNLGPVEDEYLAGGIADEIRSRLSALGKLDVISQSSSLQYRKKEMTAKQIREDSNVDYVLEGTVRWDKKSGEKERVRVMPELIRASDDTQFWAETYDGSIEDIFQVQADIAKQVIQALNITLLDSARRAFEAKPTENLEAYDFYLRGNNYLNMGSLSPNTFQMSINLLEKAVSLDSRFALAYAALSDARSNLYWYGSAGFGLGADKELAAGAKAAAERALQIDPDLPEAHVALGHYYYHVKFDFESALEELTIAQKRQRNNSEVFALISAIERRQGKWNQSAINSKKAVEIDPRSALIAFNHAATLQCLREYSEAERYFNRAISLNPENAYFYNGKAALYLQWEGKTNKARATLEEASKNQNISDEHFIVYKWILVDIFDGNYQEALERLSQTSIKIFGFYRDVPKDLVYAKIYGLMNQRKLEQEHYDSARIFLESRIKEDPDTAWLCSSLSHAYAGLGRKQDAIRQAEKAVEILPESKDASSGTVHVIDLAYTYVMVGEYDKALDKIEHLLSVPSGMSVSLLKLDPIWKPLYDHPRFKQLLEKYSK